VHHFVEILPLTLARSLRVCRNVDLILETPGVADPLPRRDRCRRIGVISDECIERDKVHKYKQCTLITATLILFVRRTVSDVQVGNGIEVLPTMTR